MFWIADALESKANVKYRYLHFWSQSLMNLQIFATVHSLMNDTNLIDRYQAHLPVQYAHWPQVTLVWWLAARHTRVARAKQASCLHHWLSVFALAVPLKIPFYTPTELLIRLHIKYIEDIQMFLLNMSFISRVKWTIFIFHEWRSHEWNIIIVHFSSEIKDIFNKKTFEFSFYYIQF